MSVKADVFLFMEGFVVEDEAAGTFTWSSINLRSFSRKRSVITFQCSGAKARRLHLLGDARFLSSGRVLEPARHRAGRSMLPPDLNQQPLRRRNVGMRNAGI